MAQCAACSAENPAQAHFCMACGAPLERRCPACGANATAGARICTAPVAHGDETERAVRAGLEMQAAMGDINEPLGRQHGVRFELCVGMNTGEVLAGRVGAGYTVVGDSVNVAARLQAAAPPGSVI